MSSGRPRAVSNMHFFVSCQIDVVNKQPFSTTSSNNPLSKIKFHSLILPKIHSFLWDICSVNGLKTFYTDVKTTERVKKQAVSKKDGRFQR